MLFTNPLETQVSTGAAITTYFSDIALGNNRIDVYSNHATIVVGQPTATTLGLTAVGNYSTFGVADAAIDQVGNWYSDGKIGGAYDLFNITGKSIPIFPYLRLQFGD